MLSLKKKKKREREKASCLKMSRVEFDQFQRMCQESWKSLPRLTRVVRAATDYWTKLQLCVLFPLSRSPAHLPLLSLPLPAIKYFIIAERGSECKWCNWQLRVKVWFQSWFCKYLSMTDLLAGWGGERRGAGGSQWSGVHWSTPAASRRSAATRGSFLQADRWPRSSGGAQGSCEGYKAGWGVEVGIRGAIIYPSLGWTVLKYVTSV